jgi:O-antigen biosynthesis protein
MKVCIGIHVHEQPEHLRTTLSCILQNTAASVRIVLLPDSPDPTTRQVLESMTELAQFGSEQSMGAPACFNRLAANTEEEVLVLLESGARVAPGWLDCLLDALEADPANGLAGPSTNLSWNEQAVFPGAGGSDAELATLAGEARQRFGDATKTLEPLYSLADFCYAVRREVIETVGAADERYGLGPCWEMDYNIRAARAGWRGVWACASYVHRSPFSERRRLEETRRFEISKRIYQDKFCGARLRGEKSDYRTHCRGDACPNFAPAAMIAIHKPIVAPHDSPIVNAPLIKDPSASAAQVAVEQSDPLVTCIMPTGDRRPYITQSIRCFLRQDYSNTELLIVDDGVDSIAGCVPRDPRIRYIHLDQKLSIGAKRNFACEQAHGEIIIHWDDDDWYPAWRVRAQTRALLEHGADVCGASRLLYYNASTEEAWEYHYDVAGANWVGGNTLAYRKSFWQRNRFPDVRVAEDSRFIWSDQKKIVRDLAEPSLCVAMVHSGNTSPKETRGSFWNRQPGDRIRAIVGDERYLYCVAPVDSSPLVSCIMPTYNRRAFIPRALEQFAAQDYPNRELIVVDDGEDEIGDLVRELPAVRYIRLPRRASIGSKRNLACQHARGEIIVQWDDDDWYSGDRLRYQVMPILLGHADLTGLENAFVLELPGGKFWTTPPPLHCKLFVGDVHGGTLAYRKELWTRGIRYPEINLAEDAWLLQSAIRGGGRLLRLSNPGVFVYIRHRTNAWKDFAPGQFVDPRGWEQTKPPLTFDSRALEFYRAVASMT